MDDVRSADEQARGKSLEDDKAEKEAKAAAAAKAEELRVALETKIEQGKSNTWRFAKTSQLSLHPHKSLAICEGRLVHRLAYNGDVVAGQLAVFRGSPSRTGGSEPDWRVRAGLAVKRPYLSHTGRASNTEKQPTGRGPEGCVENGPSAALLVGYVPHSF